MTAGPYEDILARYQSITTQKAGTAYEMLAALVCKVLKEQNTVVHDLRLRGDSGVKHQIDVRVETADGGRTVLIECKDFHERNGKVGLGIVRDFHSAVTDISPDEAWIVTCIGFTREALKYAKAKGIKPVVIRIFEEQDKDGRIFTVCINLTVVTWHDPVADIYVGDADAAALHAAFQSAGMGRGISSDDDAWFLMPDGSRSHFTQVITDAMSKAVDGKPDGAIQCVLRAEGRKFLVGGVAVPYKGIVVRFARISETETDRIVSTRLAELIATGIGATDIIIFDDQLLARRIDPDTGEIK